MVDIFKVCILKSYKVLIEMVLCNIKRDILSLFCLSGELSCMFYLLICRDICHGGWSLYLLGALLFIIHIVFIVYEHQIFFLVKERK